MTGRLVNLARRPFANTRPLKRVALALWLLGVALAVLVGWIYWRSLFGIEGKKEERARVERQIAEERRRVAAADAALAGMDLRRQNVEAAYLNARIADRTFPWSALFEHLAEVLPKKVRLYSLAPQALEPQASRTVAGRRMRALPDRVYLQMTGSAASDEDLTQLLDALFKSPWFTDPALPREQRQNGAIDFVLSVAYRPSGRGAVVLKEVAAAPPAAPPAPAPAAPAAPAKPRSGDEL